MYMQAYIKVITQSNCNEDLEVQLQIETRKGRFNKQANIREKSRKLMDECMDGRTNEWMYGFYTNLAYFIDMAGLPVYIYNGWVHVGSKLTYRVDCKCIRMVSIEITVYQCTRAIEMHGQIRSTGKSTVTVDCCESECQQRLQMSD